MASKGENRTSIGLRLATKHKLDSLKAPGQCYDGFLGQLIDLWTEIHAGGGASMTRRPRAVKHSRAKNNL